MSRFNKILALLLALLLAAPLALFTVADGESLTPLTVSSIDTDNSTPGNGSSEGLAQMFDGNENSKYLTNTVPATVIFSLDAAAVVKYYEITSADHGEWDPKAWTLSGSNDGTTWTVIDTQTNQDFLLTPDTNGYEINNSTSYQWYKLDVTESHGEAFGFYIAVSELELFDAVPGAEVIEGVVVDLTTVTGTAGNGSSEGLVQAFDGNASTKYLTATLPAEIIFALKKTAVVNNYSLTSTDHGEWDPKAWTFYGSDDGSTWAELDSQSGQDFTGRGVTNTYWIENTTEYLWYKFVITETHGEAFGFKAAVAELTPDYGVKPEEGVYVLTDTVTGTAGNGASEGLAQAFDGSPNSKYLTATVPAEIIFSLNKAAAINYYELTVTDHGEWDPKAWTFYGSDDGSTWTAIDSRSAQDFSARYATNTYFFDNSAEYLWYKLEITETHGEAYGFKAAIAELAVDVVTVDLTTVSGSAGNGDDNYYCLFDGSSATKYLVFRSSDDDVVTVSFQLTKPVTVNTYRVTSANDWAVRDPKSWTFYGSTDGTTWEVLDFVEEAVFEGRQTATVFQFANTDAYDWYKFEFTANNGTDPWGNNIIQLSEIELYNTEEEIVDNSVKVDVTTITSSAPNSDSQSADKLFDFDTGTKYLTSGSTMFVAFALKEARAVNAYTFTCASDWASRSPSDWNFYGSDDGTTWTLLDARTGETPIALKGDNRYVFENDVEYLWYKLEVTKNGGNTYTGLAELHLEVTDDPAYPTVEREIDASTVIAPNGTSGNGIANLIDGNRSTRYLVQNNGQPFDIVFQLTAPAAINRYAISGSKDHLERSPKDFSFYGSQDGETWVLLDHRELEARSSSDPNYFCGEAYAFENTTVYSWYKLSVEAVSSGNYCGMSAFTVFTAGTPEEAGPAGDIDGSGTTDIGDVTALLNCLSLSAAELEEAVAAGTYKGVDVDGNGVINITDVTVLLDLLA